MKIELKAGPRYRLFFPEKSFIPGFLLVTVTAIAIFIVYIAITGTSGQDENKGPFFPENYAPGYPDYSVSQLEQLKNFPLPRYKAGTDLRRNFPWYDFLYTAYGYDSVHQLADGKFRYPGWNGKAHGEAAIALEKELYDHWNYYFNIPTPTYNHGKFRNKNSFAGAIAAYANAHPEMQTCAYIFWAGIKPKQFGYGPAKPYIRKNSSIDPCADTTYPFIERDGLVQRQILATLFESLPDRDSLRKIDFINENGEVFGELKVSSAEGYKGHALTTCFTGDADDQRRQRAKWQRDVFKKYSTQFIHTPELPGAMNADFSFYQVSAFLPEYYPEYSVLRKVNTPIRRMYYSTPDFYPGDVNHSIFDRYSFYHGLDCIAEGRKTEIALGDFYFSPFVSAGWFKDSLNYRPAAWLAAMKALAMMGAEFYYPAYFNLVNPAKQKPVDPRGYIYQLAMPVYAQAVTSHFEYAFFHSRSFHYDRDGDFLLMWRKEEKANRFIIYASYFPRKPTQENNIPRSVTIDGQVYKINFRQQGSTYLLDRTKPAMIKFFQLDEWHESAHPSYWSQDIVVEAELSEGKKLSLRTDLNSSDTNDYSHFITYAVFPERGTQLQFHFEPRRDSVYYIWIRARSMAKESSTEIMIDGKDRFKIDKIAFGEFRWYAVEMKKAAKGFRLNTGPHDIVVRGLDAALQVDKIVVSLEKGRDE
ncbi:MAG TPA: hypothetical protein VI731_09705 [Bacteroidia bacterium]|nr:hypothetical protein [Bacteroidia bacterium]